ncbi:L,D-transpeptidase family protein [Zavarzinia compransoris]|uniref:L,D-transpeptidase family protein n=1 Tax=Zavarzinia marina TaxID=2911065 RepID=UPI001EED8B2B|nr:L,D-transpeptidase family protein [Zavarzinia marina]MCF4164411.1 L,D-transpeptidase family protein [Zavarzinia marina]
MKRIIPLACLALTIAGPAMADVDLIRIDKADRKLRLYDQGALIAEYDIRLGFSPVGPKTREGDGRTPEGRYRISAKNPASAYTLSLRVSYPDATDRARAAAAGVDPGGDIMIHGQPNRMPDFVTLPYDWTAGCVAVSNAAIREIYETVAVGTTIEIRP